MNKKEMEKYRKLLIEKREDLLEVVRQKKERDLVEVEVGDEVDSASQNADRELLFELADNEKIMLDAIESALRRIEKGSFGKCECCGEKVNEKRMQALPWVRYCIDCQSKAERS